MSLLPFALIVISLLQPTFSHPLSAQQDYLKPPTLGDYIVSFSTGQCLTPSTDPPAKGNRVVMASCEEAKTWHVPYSSGYLGLQAVGLAVEPDGWGEIEDGMMLAVPEPNNLQQRWLWGSGNRISTANGSQCLEISDDGPKLYDCDPRATNQIWVVRNTTEPQSLDALATMEARTDKGFFHPRGRNDICLAVVSPEDAHSGHGVALTYCSGTGDRTSIKPLSTSPGLMRWWLPSSSGPVKLGSSGLCLETGTKTPTEDIGGSSYEQVYGDGMAVRVENCDVGREGQQWVWDGKRMRIEGDANQCLSILGGSGPVEMSNFINLRAIHTWTCSEDDEDENQLFSA